MHDKLPCMTHFATAPASRVITVCKYAMIFVSCSKNHCCSSPALG